MLFIISSESSIKRERKAVQAETEKACSGLILLFGIFVSWLRGVGPSNIIILIIFR